MVALGLGLSLTGSLVSGQAAPKWDVLVRNDLELTAAMAAHAAAGGVTIALDPAGSYAAGRTFTQNPMARLRIISASATQAAPLPSIILSNCSKLTFENIDHSENIKTGACVTLALGKDATDIWWDKGCYFGGQPYDPKGDWSINAPTARNGFNTNGRGLRGFKVRHCLFRYLRNAIKLDKWTGACEIRRNYIDVFYDDGISLGWDWRDPAHGTKIWLNYITRCAGRESDQNGTGTPGNGPHTDGLQVYEYNDPASGDGLMDLEIIGNIVNDGDARGHLQMNLMRSTGTFVSRAKVAHNRRIANKGDDFAPMHENVHSNFVFNNAVLYSDPGNPANTSTRGEIKNSPGMPKSLFAAQMSGSIVVSGDVQSGFGMNVNVPLDNTLESHQAQFEGPFPIPLTATREEVISAFRLKTTATLGHLRDVIDYDTGEIVASLEPSWLGFSNFTEQEVDAVCTTSWRKLQGGGAGQSISVGAGAEYRLADDASGTNATEWGSTAGVLDEGRYVQARKAASSEGSTTVTATVTVEGWDNDFDISTASTASFYEVDNGGTARSTLSGTPTSSPGNTWLIMAFRWKHDTVSASSQAIFTHGTSGSALHFMMVGGTNYRVRLKGSGDFNASLSFTPDTNWHTGIVAIDLTKTSPTDVLKVYIDGSLIPTSGTPTIPTSGTVTFNQNSFADLASWGETDNGAIFDGKKSFDYIHWGSGEIPFDITDAAARDRFTADRIDTGGLGYGPTGTQPKVYLNGSAAAWDDGIENAGSLGGTFGKSAGAFT